ncbi:hypothetical protein TOPH_05595 [Tolypocladium ophioglossoides CBS 100239]|uniref:Uncharacterized protein n=1 Tax=Tolypocladium ophioglossoides (strain CBS 100239) TaxID=1163406 RepID=A0A0L0N643_TOLOC|nr:hypothetical protein TOPH_05595 [Tolypocladium ophioglossoides CBS 100239]
MDKISLLTASKVEPGVSLNPHSAIVSRLGPALAFAAGFQRVLGPFSVVLCLHAYFVANLALAYALYAGRLLAAWAFIATKLGAFHGLSVSGKAVADLWESRTVRLVRNKLFFEFAVFILGGGNSIILLLFWPGWLLVGGASWALWQFWG